MAAPASTSVIIPAYNEGPSIGGIVSALTEAAAWQEILVIDDGSDDDTADTASRAGARVIRHPYNKGQWGRCQDRITASLGRLHPDHRWGRTAPRGAGAAAGRATR